MYGYIYKTTNLIDGKIYIGQHQADHFEPDRYIGSVTALTEAISIFGRENFINELICWCANQDELNQKEIYWISEFDATNPEIGYNLALGGAGCLPTEQTKQKISNTIKSKQLHCYNNGHLNRYFGEVDDIPAGFVKGRILVNVSTETWKANVSKAASEAIRPQVSDATKMRISEAHKNTIVYNNGIVEIRLHPDTPVPEGFTKGRLETTARLEALTKFHAAAAAGNAERKNWPEEIRKAKLGKHNIGRTPVNAQSVLCLETSKVYSSIAAITKEFGWTQYKICKAIKNSTELGGYHWQFIRPEE